MAMAFGEMEKFKNDALKLAPLEHRICGAGRVGRRRHNDVVDARLKKTSILSTRPS